MVAENFLYFSISVAYFILPAGVANMAGTLTKKIKFLSTPVDFGKKINEKRIFGDNKTWRGVFFGVIAGILVALLQGYLYRYNFLKAISLVDYSKINLVLFGFLMGFGDHLGDIAESFFKRQLNIKPGDPFVPFDQIDGATGALIFTIKFYKFSLNLFIEVLAIWFVLHIITKHIGFYIGLSKRKW